MSSIKTMFLGTVAALTLVAGSAYGASVTISVPSTARPWNPSENSAFLFGIGDGSRPAVADLKLVEGMTLRITATGTTTTFRGGPALGPDGQADYIADDNPGGSGKVMPSKYVDPDNYPVRLNELIGTFVDADGHLVGAPFPVGTLYQGVVPKGAVALQFGLNDDVLADNSGELTVTIEPNVVLNTDMTKPKKKTPAEAKILPPYPPTPLRSTTLKIQHNPILADGTYYSADAAPVVVDDTLYIISGRDEAPIDGGGFEMNEWQLLSTTNVAGGEWKFYPHMLRPEKVFGWAAPGNAYAGQIIQGRDKKFYLYAPVRQADCTDRDCFGIGVAVADNVLGPWKDAHPTGPIVSQSTPVRNTIENIDPTPFVDEDGRVYLYWGTFGQLRGMELEADMITPKSSEKHIDGVRGFFEAPWLFKRKGTYYLVYADNEAGPDSPCTPAVYHACIAYGTSDSPLGPWTYRGVILPPVSSTTSHPGVIEFKNKWYMTYHTADAKNGGHFRRSVAIDELEWDDTVSPAAIKPVKTTPPKQKIIPPQRNIAPAAAVFVSNNPVPAQYWTKALNDGIVRPAPLPPDMWGTWEGMSNPPEPWIAYLWSVPVELNGARIFFWNDHPAGSGEGVAPPKAWHLETCEGTAWKPVKAATPYATDTNRFVEVTFEPVKTKCLRAVFDASSSGAATAGVAVEEFEALATKPMEIQLP